MSAVLLWLKEGGGVMDPILPPLCRTQSDAHDFARIVHTGQRDKSGKPYITHLQRVRDRVLGLSADCDLILNHEDDIEQIAWLHDTIEDTSVTADDLLCEGFSPTVVGGVELLTRKDGVGAGGQRVTYDEWVRWLCEIAPLAIVLVKLADVEDNSDPGRLALLDEPTRERLTKKYAGAADLLREAARKRGWQG